LDADQNQVVVGPRALLRARRLVLRNVNWLGDGSLEAVAETGAEIYARIRSSQDPQPATLAFGPDGALNVELANGEEGIAAGQACVFYSDGAAESRVLGGGFIVKTLEQADAPHAA